MTVRTLIKKLSKMPQNARVTTSFVDYSRETRFYNIKNIVTYYRNKGNGGALQYKKHKFAEKVVVVE